MGVVSIGIESLMGGILDDEFCVSQFGFASICQGASKLLYQKIRSLSTESTQVLRILLNYDEPPKHRFADLLCGPATHGRDGL